MNAFWIRLQSAIRSLQQAWARIDALEAKVDIALQKLRETRSQ